MVFSLAMRRLSLSCDLEFECDETPHQRLTEHPTLQFFCLVEELQGCMTDTLSLF